MAKSIEERENNFFRKAKERHGDKYDYSLVKYVSAKTPVTVICPIHGEFNITPDCHTAGSIKRARGCVRCSRTDNYVENTQEFIEVASRVHQNRYDYTESVYTKAKDKVRIICPKHGEFQMSPDKHIGKRGMGCVECGIEDRFHENIKPKTKRFIDRAQDIYGTEKFDYSQSVFLGGSEKIKIRCIKHDTWFWQQPNNHFNYAGSCPRCRKEGAKGGNVAGSFLSVDEYSKLYPITCLYLMKISNSDEVFIKFGISKRPQRRTAEVNYALKRQYDVELVDFVRGPSHILCKIENYIHSTVNTLKRHKCLLEFSGSTECYHIQELEKFQQAIANLKRKHKQYEQN